MIMGFLTSGEPPTEREMERLADLIVAYSVSVYGPEQGPLVALAMTHCACGEDPAELPDGLWTAELEQAAEIAAELARYGP
jgi:hypothetical protein